jgi:hypothetical protein
MDLPNRIELAARADDPEAWQVGAGVAIPGMASRRQMSINRVTYLLTAAFPGLFTDPPQVWLAPVEATFEMKREWRGDDFECHYVWKKLRDAYLAS